MYVQRVNHLESLLPYRERWDALAGDCVFRNWTWLSTWWQHYGQACSTHELATLLVFEEETRDCTAEPNGKQGDTKRLVAILPCYLQHSLTRGRVLRLLGDGEVCSDHLDLLVDPKNAERVATALADYLTGTWADWDLIDFSAIDADNVSLEPWFTALQSQGCHLSRSPGLSNWGVELPDSWEHFLARQSKSHRKQLRRLEKRVLMTGQATWHLVDSPEEFETAWAILVDLHQRRRNSLGEPGCFASERWASFHHDVAKQLLAAEQLRLSWLEIDGQPVAAEYNLAGSKTTFAYQAGIDPDRLDEGPGRLSMIRTVQHAIDEGHRQFDLLRGDEPYKAHWRATPRETCDVQVVPARSTSRWRFQAWTCLRRAKSLARIFVVNI